MNPECCCGAGLYTKFWSDSGTFEYISTVWLWGIHVLGLLELIFRTCLAAVIGGCFMCIPRGKQDRLR